MLSATFEKLASDEIQTFLFELPENHVSRLQFQNKEMSGLPFKFIAGQLTARKKIQTKLPLFYETKGILYPPTINLEQSSSQATANFKGEIIKREIGKDKLTIADLTGGFGVDSYFLSKLVESIDFVEPNPELINIARHNHYILGSVNINYHCARAEDFLADHKSKFDLIYIDPSRRDSQSKKIFRLSDAEPIIVNLLPTLLSFTDCVLIKASPLLDIQQGLLELSNVKKVMVVSVENECKELLFLINKEHSKEAVIETYNLSRSGEIRESFSFTFTDEKNCHSDFGNPLTYLYEPNSSVLKSGAFKLVGKRFGLKKIQANTHFYTSSLLEKNFPGRIFKIEEMNFDRKNFAEKKANVIARNYPLKAEELKKKLKLTDGGDKYVIGFSGERKKFVVLATRLA